MPLSLVDASVAAYQRRGFKNLMVSFGCTGGQHRSVYLAEQLARHLRGSNGRGSRSSGTSSLRRLGKSRRSWANEGDDSGRRPGHAPAAAHRRPPQGAGHRCRPHAAGDRSRAPALLRRARGHRQHASLRGHDRRLPEGQPKLRHEDRDLPRGGVARHRRRLEECRMVFS